MYCIYTEDVDSAYYKADIQITTFGGKFGTAASCIIFGGFLSHFLSANPVIGGG